MEQNIYTALGFKSLKNPIYSDEVINEAKKLFDSFPLRNIRARQLIIKENLFAESFAISTAEDSDLTKKEALEIQISPETEARIIKYRNNKDLPPDKKYRELEFENIKSLELLSSPLSFAELSAELICQVHYDLTVGLDDYCKAVGHSRYYSGKLRHSNDIKVGKIMQYIPPDYKKITNLLNLLIRHFKNKKEIHLSDIFEFHLLFYAIHPFSNGNKRVARILESLLLHYYGFGMERMFSMSPFYTKQRDDYTFSLLVSIRNKFPDPFVNFALTGYFYAGKDVFKQAGYVYMFIFKQQFENFLKMSVPPKYHKRFSTALSVILELNGHFSNTEFIKKMGKKGISSGVAQRIIGDLKEAGILKHSQKFYYTEKGSDIDLFFRTFDQFTLKYGIILEQD